MEFKYLNEFCLIVDKVVINPVENTLTKEIIEDCVENLLSEFCKNLVQIGTIEGREGVLIYYFCELRGAYYSIDELQILWKENENEESLFMSLYFKILHVFRELELQSYYYKIDCPKISERFGYDLHEWEFDKEDSNEEFLELKLNEIREVVYLFQYLGILDHLRQKYKGISITKLGELFYTLTLGKISANTFSKSLGRLNEEVPLSVESNVTNLLGRLKL